MRKLAAVLATLVVVAIAGAHEPAEAKTKKKRVYKPPHATQGHPATRSETYQEFIADKRPIGTMSWWEQMDREGRGGQSRAN